MNNELEIETDFEDYIYDAISNALSNADGHYSAKYLRYELRKRGLQITTDVPVAWRVKNTSGHVIGCYIDKSIALNVCGYGYTMEPLYAALT